MMKILSDNVVKAPLDLTDETAGHLSLSDAEIEELEAALEWTNDPFMGSDGLPKWMIDECIGGK